MSNFHNEHVMQFYRNNLKLKASSDASEENMNIAKLLGVISFICWIVACVLTICIDVSSVFSQALAQGMCAYLTFVLLSTND